jgi:23S rRNA (cytosine1962-C5)-methyltransferase
MPAVRPAVFPHPAFPEHALLDSGDGEKLERFGAVTLARPDPQAIWRRRRPELWRAADLVFERDPASDGRAGRWRVGANAPAACRGRDAQWPVRFADATFLLRPTPFKHVGLFPEQAANWRWVEGLAAELAPSGAPRLLNLFGYTGAATVLAAQAGFAVTHVDASKTSLAWARDNARASGLAEDAVRFLLDDARAFAQREVRRGSRYAGILVDPPHYGRGPKGETWQLEEHLAGLFADVARLLDERAFVCLSAYAVGFLPTAFTNLLDELGPDLGAGLDAGVVHGGELALPEEGAEPPRRLSCGMCARWSRGLASAGSAA